MFIQGRYGNSWINIIQDLPLAKARKARYSQRKSLVMQQALDSYSQFIQSKDEKYLTNAKTYIQDFKSNQQNVK